MCSFDKLEVRLRFFVVDQPVFRELDHYALLQVAPTEPRNARSCIRSYRSRPRQHHRRHARASLDLQAVPLVRQGISLYCSFRRKRFDRNRIWRQRSGGNRLDRLPEAFAWLRRISGGLIRLLQVEMRTRNAVLNGSRRRSVHGPMSDCANRENLSAYSPTRGTRFVLACFVDANTNPDHTANNRTDYSSCGCAAPWLSNRTSLCANFCSFARASNGGTTNGAPEPWR